VEDLSDWRDEGSIFTYYIDEQWDVMYAPDLVEIKRRDGTKDYYLYPHSRGHNREAMVAKGSSPVGLFTPVNISEDGRSTLPNSCMGFDPAVYIEYIDDPNDPDYEIGFRAYGYWGYKGSYAAELDQNTMYSVRPGTEIIQRFIPASASYGEIHDPEGTTYPRVFPDEDLSRFNFYEAASIRKIGNKYIWVYSGYSGPDYGLESTNSALRYAFGDTPLGPWRSGGVLVDSRAVIVNRDGTALQTSYSGHNTHGSIELVNGQWYAFYHRAPRGFGYMRQPMVAPIAVTWDETSVADGGRVIIRAYDPYSADSTWTAKAGDFEYTGAEVTSEGFNIFGMNPYEYYSAGIACYLSNNDSQTDAWDIWENHAPIVGVTNGDIIGYKYFDLRKTERNTRLNLFFKPKTTNAFKVGVWLDCAYKGTKIGEITASQSFVDVSEYIEKLNKKHALFLVAEGGVGELFDLIGLGFSSDETKIERPKIPTIEIKGDKQLIPVRSTEANGITGYDVYEVEVDSDAVEMKIEFDGAVKTFRFKK
jgi:hypothetical protein